MRECAKKCYLDKGISELVSVDLESAVKFRKNE